MSEHKVKRRARAAFFALAAVAWVTLFSAIAYGWQPDLGHAAMLTVTAWIQVLRRRDWENGIPSVYQHSRMVEAEDMGYCGNVGNEEGCGK